MTVADIVAQVRILAAAYPRTPVPAETVAVYAVALADVEAGALVDAVARHVRTSPFFPTIAEIRTAVAEAAAAVPDPEAILAEVRAAIGDRGYNRPPRDGDLSPVALAVIDVVGWQTLCNSDNPEADRAHVLRVAGTLRRRCIEAVNLSSSGLAPAVPCPPLAGRMPAARRFVSPRVARLGVGLSDLLDDLRPKDLP